MSNLTYQIAQNKYGSYCVPLNSSYTITSQAIIAGKIHEPSTIDFILKNSSDGDIIHARAGFGDFFPALSALENKTIWSFEPNTENFQCAKKTIEINEIKNIRLMNFALGDKNSTKKLKVKEFDKFLGPRSQITLDSENSNDMDYEVVITRALDDLIPKTRKISLIHLDIEGFEENVIEGAKKIIEKDAPLIVLEIHSEALKYNRFMESINYLPLKHLIYDSGPMVFVNTVYKCGL